MAEYKWLEPETAPRKRAIKPVVKVSAARGRNGAGRSTQVADPDSAYTGVTLKASTPRLWFVPSLSGMASVGEITDADGKSRFYVSGGARRTAGPKNKGGFSLTGDIGYFDGSSEEFARDRDVRGGSVGPVSGSVSDKGWSAGFGTGAGATYYDGKVKTRTTPAFGDDLKILFPFLMLPGVIRSLASSKKGLL